MSDLLRVDVRHAPGHSVVAPRGGVYFDTVGPLVSALTPLVRTDRPQVVLDLSGMSSCDSSGLNLMVRAHHAATDRGGWLRLAGLNPSVRRVVDVTNLSRLLAIYGTVREAVDDRR